MVVGIVVIYLNKDLQALSSKLFLALVPTYYFEAVIKYDKCYSYNKYVRHFNDNLACGE